jgi:hypothetical protein
MSEAIGAISGDEDLCGTCRGGTMWEVLVRDDDGVPHHFRCWGYVCRRCGGGITDPSRVYDTGLDLYHVWCVNKEDEDEGWH